MRQCHDDGESTFDKFRSPQSVEIVPEGGITQKYMETETFNESEEESLNMMARCGTEYYERRRFNLQNGEGGSTYVAGRNLGHPGDHPMPDEMPGGPANPRR
jgi:hypothetical protein